MAITPTTHLEKSIAGEIEPITHFEKVIAGKIDPVTHLEQVVAKYGGGGEGQDLPNAEGVSF